jgi:ferredoxin
VAMPHADKAQSLRNLKVEVELGYDDKLAAKEAERCLNCDIQTVFSAPLCIECDACMDICPVDCINFIHNDAEAALREKLRVPARNKTQDLYVSDVLKTGRIMPDGRLGHAEVHVRGSAGFTGLSDASQCLSALVREVGSHPAAQPAVSHTGAQARGLTPSRTDNEANS